MIVVSGASGFIGKRVVKKALEIGDEITVLVRNEEKYVRQGNERVIECSLQDIGFLKRKLMYEHIESVIHLAWEGIPDYSYSICKKNLIMGLSVLNLCKEIGASKIVFSGSCWEYKNPVGAVRVDSPLDTEKPFSAAKNSLHSMGESFCSEFGINIGWLRLFYVYGPGQREAALIPYLISSYKNGINPILNGGNNKNDFIYVDDAADAILKSAHKRDQSETLNIGTGKAVCVLDIVKYTAEALGKPFDGALKQNPSHPNDFFADITGNEEKIGWVANTSIKEGLNCMIDCCEG